MLWVGSPRSLLFIFISKVSGPLVASHLCLDACFFFCNSLKVVAMKLSYPKPKKLSKNFFMSLSRIRVDSSSHRFFFFWLVAPVQWRLGWHLSFRTAFSPMLIFVATAVSFVGWLLLVAYLIFADTESGAPRSKAHSPWYIPLLQRSAANSTNWTYLEYNVAYNLLIFRCGSSHQLSFSLHIAKPRHKVRISTPPYFQLFAFI